MNICSLYFVFFCAFILYLSLYVSLLMKEMNEYLKRCTPLFKCSTSRPGVAIKMSGLSANRALMK